MTYSELQWSGTNPPPAIGMTIKAEINGIGLCKVTGYFADGGYLGVLAKPLNPPAWYVKQNGKDAIGHFFGAEIIPWFEPA